VKRSLAKFEMCCPDGEGGCKFFIQFRNGEADYSSNFFTGIAIFCQGFLCEIDEFGELLFKGESGTSKIDGMETTEGDP